MSAELHSIERPIYNVSLILPENCTLVWKEVRGLLEPAVERSHGRWTMEHLFAILCMGYQSLWIAYDANMRIHGALTTQIVRYPNTSMVACQFLGGDDFEHWGSAMLDTIKRYAKDSSCSGVEATGRFGFWPFFKKEGFERSYTVYEGDI